MKKITVLLLIISCFIIYCTEKKDRRGVLLGLTALAAQQRTVISGNAPSSSCKPIPASGCLPSTSGKTWDVGTGKPYPTIGSVDWNNLGAGDVVRIHWRAVPYAEKILLSTSGTVEKPIRVCGVPGGPSVGDSILPTITGMNATTRSDLAFQNNSADSYNAQGVFVLEPSGLITIQNRAYEKKPSNIIIEGLHLTGTRTGTTFTGANGNTSTHIDFSACVRVQKGDNITIRGNEINDCGHAIFALSRDNESQTSRNLVIEGNYLYGNGAVGSESVHSMYIQTIGASLKFNYLGSNRPGSGGAIYKSRSVGDIVCHNWFAQGARIIDLVDPQDYDTSYLPAARAAYAAQYPNDKNLPSIAQVESDYQLFQKTYIYGNFIRNECIGGSGQCASSPIHFGGDQGGAEQGRRGTLYFFNNTIVTLNDYVDSTRLSTFDMGLGSTFTRTNKIEAFNNIIHLQLKTPNPSSGQFPDHFLTRHTTETLNLGTNWITDRIQPQGADLDDNEGMFGVTHGMGIITGFTKCTTCTTSPVNTTTLVPLKGNASLINQGKALPTGLEIGYELQVNHTSPLLSKSVVRATSNRDLGAAAVLP